MSNMNLLRPARFFRLVSADAKNAFRDPVLLYVILISVLPVVAFTFWGDKIETATGIPDLIRLALPTILTFSGFMVGWVAGFLILEERDDGPIMAIEVTPLGKEGLVINRLVLTFLLAALIAMFSVVLLAPFMGWGMRIFYASMIGFEAISVALILPTLASNKVEGLAVAKITNIAALMPMLALWPTPWRYLGSIFPTYWIGESYQFTPVQYFSLPVILTIAVAMHVGIVLLLYWLYNRKVG